MWVRFPVFFTVNNLPVSQNLQVVLHISVTDTLALFDLIENLIDPNFVGLFLPVEEI